MTELLHKMYTAIHIATAGLVLALAGIGVLYLAYDRQKARFLVLREVMRAYLAKARNDRNDKIRMPADQVQEMFELQEERVIQSWKAPFRIHRHPAAQPPNRGKG